MPDAFHSLASSCARFSSFFISPVQRQRRPSCMPLHASPDVLLSVMQSRLYLLHAPSHFFTSGHSTAQPMASHQEPPPQPAAENFLVEVPKTGLVAPPSSTLHH
ncbi:hypothetical protein KP509_39G000300 [Ceratopteris richardii]|uniref:Uncharacterized protein n=1 Tax=Ceratopteris richardii TaxID=49495 RepID=A0A8T2PYC6_CERRI|nr:hypothetical protein KP509_39G000300 [Ceratopteris richardii]